MTQVLMEPGTAPVDVDAHRERLLQTLPGRLVIWAHDRPDAVALRDKRYGRWREITWREYLDRVQAVALALRETGVAAGDHVAIHSNNRPEFLYVDLAVQGMGGRSVGVYETNPAPAVAYLLNHSQSVALFAEDQEQVDKAVAVRHQTETVRNVVVFEPRGTRGYEDPRLQPWDAFLERGRELLESEPHWFVNQVLDLDPDAPSMVVYTSGTTGNPKGAMLSSRNALACAEPLYQKLGFTEDDLILSYLPLCHVAEKLFSVFASLIAGPIVHFGESIETIRADLREVSPTIFLGVPRIWEKMHASVNLRMGDASRLKRALFTWAIGVGRQAPAGSDESAGPWLRVKLWLADVLVMRALQEKLGLRRCHYAVSGAAPISPEILQWFRAIGVPIREGYGQTECAGISHSNVPGRDRLGSVGHVVDGMECVIADDGEILLRGPAVFLGYLHNPEGTAQTIDEDGWLHTGDIGSIDDDGFLWITGRKKELIITSGGKNLSPERIENALKTSPYINEVVAVGDARKFVAALVQIEYEVVADWASHQGIQYTSFEDLSRQPDVLKLLDREVNRCNELLARVEQVRTFRTLPKQLNEDDGELTATRKVRRRNVTSAYEILIEDMYTR